MKYEHDTNKGLKSIQTYMKGLHWLYVNKEHSLSVICHKGSYGKQQGNFEICPSWRKPNKYDRVAGFLSFTKVGEWIDELMKL